VIEFIYSFPIGKLGDVPLLLDRGHRWYPLIPDNVAKMILTVAAPGNLEIFSAGDMTSTTKMSDSTRVTWESSWPVFKIPLLIANNGYYREVKRECNNQKELSLCYVSADSATAQAMLDEVCRSFEFFSQYIGEYSHNTFRLLEVPQFPGTNIGTGIITFGKDEIDAFKAGYSDRIDLAVAEQWMGAGIFGKFADRGFWFLSLSLPHYLRMMYLQKAVSEGAFQKSLNDSYNAYRPVAGTDKDIPILDVDFLNTKEKGVIIYGKGPYLVNFLRNKLGDEPWEMFWKALYRDYGGKVISFDQFCESLQGHDKDKTIIPEFRKLVGEKGLLPE